MEENEKRTPIYYSNGVKGEGKKVMETLRSKGGSNPYFLNGEDEEAIYYIGEHDYIVKCDITSREARTILKYGTLARIHYEEDGYDDDVEYENEENDEEWANSVIDRFFELSCKPSTPHVEKNAKENISTQKKEPQKREPRRTSITDNPYFIEMVDKLFRKY